LFISGKNSMKRLLLTCLLAGATIALPCWHETSAIAQPADVSPKEAFEAARMLGTADAWEAFLANYSTGFYADLARAYLKKLKDQAGPAAPPPSTPAADADDLPPTDPTKPAVARGAKF